MASAGRYPRQCFGHSVHSCGSLLDLWPTTGIAARMDCPAGRRPTRVTDPSEDEHHGSGRRIGCPRHPGRSREPARERAGPPEVLFCIVTGAAPLAAMMFNVPVAVLGGGYAAPAAFLIATIALTIFSVGYIEMARRVTSTGGFYAFITRGLGPVWASASGVLIALCYLIFTGAVIGRWLLRGDEHRRLVRDRPARLRLHGVGLAIMSAFAFFHIELTAKILGVALVAEVLALLVLASGSSATAAAPTASGRAAEPVRPLRQQRRHRGLRRGRDRHRHLRRVLVLGRLRDGPELRRGVARPKRIAKLATYASVIGLGLFYIFCSYMFVTGWGLERLGEGRRRPVLGRVSRRPLPADRPLRRRAA